MGLLFFSTGQYYQILSYARYSIYIIVFYRTHWRLNKRETKTIDNIKYTCHHLNANIGLHIEMVRAFWAIVKRLL